jgi:hypothetical protein
MVHLGSNLIKNSEKPKSKPTWIIDDTLDPPNRGVMGNFFFETFRISCGELVEHVGTLRVGIGAY